MQWPGEIASLTKVLWFDLQLGSQYVITVNRPGSSVLIIMHSDGTLGNQETCTGFGSGLAGSIGPWVFGASGSPPPRSVHTRIVGFFFFFLSFSVAVLLSALHVYILRILAPTWNAQAHPCVQCCYVSVTCTPQKSREEGRNKVKHTRGLPVCRHVLTFSIFATFLV